jgi:hypothetical protein
MILTINKCFKIYTVKKERVAAWWGGGVGREGGTGGGGVGQVGSGCRRRQSGREERVAMGIIWKPMDEIMK